MKICAEGHKEICFEGDYCPICALLVPLIDKIKQLIDMNDSVEIHDDFSSGSHGEWSSQSPELSQLFEALKERLSNYENQSK